MAWGAGALIVSPVTATEAGAALETATASDPKETEAAQANKMRVEADTGKETPLGTK